MIFITVSKSKCIHTCIYCGCIRVCVCVCAHGARACVCAYSREGERVCVCVSALILHVGKLKKLI